MKLSSAQLNRLSEITGNLGLLFLGVMVLPLLSGVEEFNLILTGFGLFLSLLSWYASILLMKGIRL